MESPSKITFRLEPQSPIIHFQYDQAGVTLRASEVKPKLDKFLEKKKGNIPADWKIEKQDKALNYKIRISLRQESKIDQPNKIFYGNTNSKREKDFKEKNAVISYPNITIVCFNNDLLQFIKENIREFFIVTNFGTMQSKGFGSFIVADENKTEKEIVNTFKSNGIEAVYKICFNNKKGNFIYLDEPNCDMLQKMFDQIKIFYSVMKSGMNMGSKPQKNSNNPKVVDESKKSKGRFAHSFLLRYMHDEFDIDNEKAWMKEFKISPNVVTNNERKEDIGQKNSNPRYVRAMFGKGDSINYFKNKKLRNEDKISIGIQHSKKKIERIPSIIQFKIIGNCVFILGKKVPKKVYNQKFTFSGYKKMSLSTPSTDDFEKCGNEFPIEDFLDKYMNYYNGKLRDEELFVVRNCQKVVKCE